VKNKTLLLLLAGLLFSVTAGAQIHMLRNLDLARSIANKSGRLIVMDFWASWCGPCKIMDAELWKSPEIQNVSKNFIGVRIDVEVEKTLVKRYQANSIPKVVIITVNGDVIWEQEGYDQAGTFLRVFEMIPENVSELNKHLQILAADKNDIQANYSAGLEFQRLGKINKNNKLKSSFLNNSEIYLNRALKLCTDSLLTGEIELNSKMNKELLNQLDN
jgi:thiol-disulfide isomerase/thioredoxin